MKLTRDFRETMHERLRRDPAFRKALLTEAVDCLLSCDVETANSLLRDYVDATIGFDELGELTAMSPNNLNHMLSSAGKIDVHNLFKIIHCMQEREDVHLKVHEVPRAV